MFKMAGKNVRKIIWGLTLKIHLRVVIMHCMTQNLFSYMILPAMLDYWDSGMRNDR